MTRSMIPIPHTRRYSNRMFRIGQALKVLTPTENDESTPMPGHAQVGTCSWYQGREIVWSAERFTLPPHSILCAEKDIYLYADIFEFSAIYIIIARDAAVHLCSFSRPEANSLILRSSNPTAKFMEPDIRPLNTFIINGILATDKNDPDYGLRTSTHFSVSFTAHDLTTHWNTVDVPLAAQGLNVYHGPVNDWTGAVRRRNVIPNNDRDDVTVSGSWLHLDETFIESWQGVIFEGTRIIANRIWVLFSDRIEFRAGTKNGSPYSITAEIDPRAESHDSWKLAEISCDLDFTAGEPDLSGITVHAASHPLIFEVQKALFV